MRFACISDRHTLNDLQKDLFELLPVGFCTLDAGARLVSADEVAVDLLGLEGEVKGARFLDLPICRREVELLFSELKAKGRAVDIVVHRNQYQGQSEIRLWVTAKLDRPSGLAGLLIRRAPTPQYHREGVSAHSDPQELVQVFEFLAPLFESSGVGLAIRDPTLAVLFETPIWENIRCNALRVERDASSTGFRKGVSRIAERTVRTEDGAVYEAIESEFHSGVADNFRIGVAWDATELWEAYQTIKEQAEELARLNKEIRSLANKDGLTEIFNRRYLEESIESEVERSNRYDSDLSVIFFDVDDFKAYNDAFGHVAGDAVLRAITQIVSGRIRRTDIFARYGGEEFAILLPETPLRRAAIVAEGIRKQIAGAGWPNRGVTVSLGVATRKNGDTPLKFLERVDKAMYAAKRSGRDQLFIVNPDGQMRASKG
ncbi:MAG: hypothetical protein AUK47_11395 [Deltaproteobacteria bacterium CG2_30_63_29]|nr:MAG: hypothetical protein AUK47_11395 [Deltaproteobacteria bacterium CG2_30_63_29]